MIVAKKVDIRWVNFVSIIFLMSGFSAILYQIAWQRLLFSVFGVDIESVTVVVTVFMFGVGVGGIAGGFLADRWRRQCFIFFFIAEALIGFFGFFSSYLIGLVANSEHLIVNFAKVFSLLMLPTILMGMTLPLLSVALVERGRIVADAVGKLYYCNTLGAAIACFLVGFFFFKYMGLQTVIYLAALINIIVSGIGFCIRKWCV